MSIRFYINDAPASYDSASRDSVDTQTRNGCVSLNIRTQEFTKARLEVAFLNLFINDSAEINGRKFSALMQSSSDYTVSVGTGIRRVSGSSSASYIAPKDITPLQEFSDNLIFRYVVNTADYVDKMSNGASDGIRIGLEKNIWIIGQPVSANQFVAQTVDGIAGYGAQVNVATGDVLEIRQTPTSFIYLVNGVTVQTIARQVAYNTTSSFGTLSTQNTQSANSSVTFTAKERQYDGSGNIIANFNDGNTANLQINIAAFAIKDVPSSVQASSVTQLTATGNANWSDGDAAGGFNPASGGVVRYTAPTSAQTVTITAVSVCDPTIKATAAISVIEPLRAKLNGIYVPSFGSDCAHIGSNSMVQFTATGGSGHYQWSASSGVIGNSTGIYLAPPKSTDATVYLTDQITGDQVQYSLCIEATMDIIIREITSDPALNEAPEYVESTLETGECTQFEVPSAAFSVPDKNLHNRVPDWANRNLMDAFGSYGQLTSRAANAGAQGDCIPSNVDGRYTQTIHPSMIAAATDSIIAGLSNTYAVGVLGDIDFGIGVNNSGKIEIWENGISRGEFGAATSGHTVSVSREMSIIKYYSDDEVVFTSTQNAHGTLCINIAAGAPNIVFAGPAQAVWSIQTPGAGAEVGVIDVNGKYCAPQNLSVGEVMIQASVNGVTHLRKVALIDPLLNYQDPAEFVTGDGVQVFLLSNPVPVGQRPRISKSGSLDRLTNPRAIAVGEVEGGYSFKDVNNFKEIGGDRGTLGITRSKPKAMLEFTMLSHRNVKRLTAVMSQLTAKRIPGAIQVSAGNSYCSCPMTVIVVVPSKACSDKYDALVLHRAEAMTDLDVAYKIDEFVMHKVKISAFLDTRRPKDEQLYSFYFGLDVEDLEGCECGCD